MNREIIYRGKRCSNGEWVYGFYVESKYSWQGHKPHKSWIVPNAISNGGFFNVLGRYAVKDDTVGEFTGMKDKHGNKVFEGDIVEYGRSLYVCEFVEGGFAFRDISDDRLTLNAILIEAEVIGNIHNNPELLSTK